MENNKIYKVEKYIKTEVVLKKNNKNEPSYEIRVVTADENIDTNVLKTKLEKLKNIAEEYYKSIELQKNIK